MITSIKDVADAMSEGRIHIQRFTKAAGVTGDSSWTDWAYSSGQPAYDARIGSALEFTPQVAARNDAIYFPGISSGQTRHLVGVAMYPTASGTGQLNVEFEMYDLLGVYPLIDGDSIDLQTLDNTLPLPRYSDGVGVKAVLVNHVAPAINTLCQTTIEYTDADDVARTMTVWTLLNGVTKACASLSNAASTGLLYLPDAGRGVKRIDSITFAAPPGGLFALYLVKPIAQVPCRMGTVGATTTGYSAKCFCSQNSFVLPQILDGAHLGFFYSPNGSSRTVTIFGYASFIWG